MRGPMMRPTKIVRFSAAWKRDVSNPARSKGESTDPVGLFFEERLFLRLVGIGRRLILIVSVVLVLVISLDMGAGAESGRLVVMRF